MRAPFQLDLHVPNFNWPDTPPEAFFDKLTEIATTAERSGFSCISMMDHLHQIPPVGPPENWMMEGNAILAALAARTSSIHLGLLVGGVTYRNPALVAKLTTTIDVISGGRAVLGIGAAWFEEEHKAYGFDFPPLKERFERPEDALNITRMLFTQDVATYEGKHHRVVEAFNNPKPLRGDIPILIGGSGERKTLRFVAKYADGSNLFGDVERVKHLLGVLEGHCNDVGRDIGEITKTRMGTLYIARTHEEAEKKLEPVVARAPDAERARAQALVGAPDEVAEQVQAYLDAGLDGITLSMPDVHDTEMVALAGETLGAVIGTRAAYPPRTCGGSPRSARPSCATSRSPTPTRCSPPRSPRAPVRARTGARPPPGPRARRDARSAARTRSASSRTGSAARESCCTRCSRSGAGSCGGACWTRRRASAG